MDHSPILEYSKFQFSSVAQSCPTLCDPMNRSTPGLPVHHLLPEFTQTHIHRVSDAIQPSHPLSSPSPPAPNPSQHQSLFQFSRSEAGSGSRWVWEITRHYYTFYLLAKYTDMNNATEDATFWIFQEVVMVTTNNGF